jgi:hypothetical protein
MAILVKSPRHYRGWRSTKLHLALLTMALLTGVYVAAGLPAEQFGNYCTAIVGCLGFYAGSAAAEKFSEAK